MINATVAGRLGADPEIKHSQGGTAVLRMRVASNDRAKVDGEWKDVTTWLTVLVFGKRAEGLTKILSKGAPIVASGKLQERTYEKRDGTEGRALEVVANEVEPLGGKPQGGGDPGPGSGSGDTGGGFDDSGDIPF